MTPRQIELARHALGFDGRNKISYRNHFVVGPGCDDYNEWVAMVFAGYANRYPPREISGGMDTFSVRREAALSVRTRDEHLSPDFRE
jgi:hypothetical protein